MFKDHYYRHQNCLDVDIYVLKVQYSGPTYLKVKVHFVDRKHTIVFQNNTTIKIKRKDLPLWQNVK